MNPAGRYVVTCLALSILLLAVGVVGRVATGVWDAEKVIAVVIAVPLMLLIAAMAWRWWE